MKKWALVIDVARCTNCQNCVLATRDEHSGNDDAGSNAPGADWIRIERRTRGSDAMVDVTYVPKTCNHCQEAPCVRAAGDGTIYIRPDGVVVIDPAKARGRRDLVDSCPYGVITWNAADELPQKWSFDTHLTDAGWRQPRCAQACPTGAMQSLRLSDDEFQQLRKRDALEDLRPELQSRPRVVYRNLHRAQSSFLGGNVVRRLEDGGLDNVSGARVELILPGAASDRETDGFGDFKFDGLTPNESGWTLRVSHPRYGTATAQGVLSESRYIGSLLLA